MERRGKAVCLPSTAGLTRPLQTCIPEARCCGLRQTTQPQCLRSSPRDVSGGYFGGSAKENGQGAGKLGW